MNFQTQALGGLAVAWLACAAQAQVGFNEVEPNGMKSEATPATGLVAGDTLNGTTTGTATTLGLGTLATADTWRLQTAAAPLGIYRHTLVVTTAGTAGHAGTIRGLNQVNGVIGTTDSTLQTSSATSAVPRSNTWYGFGRQEEIYWRITGATATTSPYVATLSTATVTPIVVPGTFNPGMVVISTYQQGHSTDTEIYLYDSSLNPVPLGHNDGTVISGIGNSILTMPNLPAGTYYVAVSNYNTANNQSDANPDDPYQSDPLLDFPNAMSNSSTTTNLNVTFSVTDGTNTVQQAATKVNAYDIVWAVIQVGSGMTATPFCFGDGSGTACPCANHSPVGAGEGCLTSFGVGGKLTVTGNASLAADTVVLAGSQMPNAPALYFQGTTQVNGGLGSLFGDGLRCAGGTVVRLKQITNAGGASQYPEAGDPSVSVRGLVTMPGSRTYQIWFRNNAPFCTPDGWNLTNGVEVPWSM
jgi:hypothetical protein